MYKNNNNFRGKEKKNARKLKIAGLVLRERGWLIGCEVQPRNDELVFL